MVVHKGILYVHCVFARRTASSEFDIISTSKFHCLRPSQDILDQGATQLWIYLEIVFCAMPKDPAESSDTAAKFNLALRTSAARHPTI